MLPLSVNGLSQTHGKNFMTPSLIISPLPPSTPTKSFLYTSNTPHPQSLKSIPWPANPAQNPNPNQPSTNHRQSQKI
ncbi:hypothetical protein PtA15_16A304 [Puccinia triticina]|uniref:Uncharacterized protein n=1 Tax=Puccinia triticina TaxID=208348 RepID=A0ABY7D7R9_9BASI|nr:uncharacterized protein PtA15_16A304 [Puccinia triticina]WAQ92396.1 hypothetical protein PtA15_16A304 [Puccinia triticina]WAR64134.1 hypothetical protein PtB15_16B294 [Puccinia triticina]